MSATRIQELVDEHFSRVAPQWGDLYAKHDVFSVIHQQRRAIALDLVEQQHLSPGSRMLDIGCGAGVISIELARRGYAVNAMDAVPAMVELTQRYSVEAGVSVSVECGDAHHLKFRDKQFDVVVAMGVTPFLHSLPDALGEMSRVLQPGGLLIVNADNRWRLSRLMDPLLSPFLTWPRMVVKWTLETLRLRKRTEEPQLVRMYSKREFDKFLEEAEFEKLVSSMLGFGPFTSFQRKLLSDRAGLRVHKVLQRWADRGVPIIRSLGAQYIVLARKRALPVRETGS